MGDGCSCFSIHDTRNIHRATEYGDLVKLRQILEEGVSVDCIDWSGETPLHKAAKWNDIEVIDFLIRQNCDLNFRNRKGLTPVALAALFGRRDVVIFLLQHGANVNCFVREHNFTLLHKACELGWTDVVQIIVKTENADLNAAEEKTGRTPLMMAVKTLPFGFREVEKTNVAAILIQAGADVNKSDSKKWTALHYASVFPNIEMVKLLVGVKSLNINLQDNDGKTTLHIASSHGDNELVKLLLGVDSLNINLQDARGNTVLHWACLLRHRETVELLVKASADTTIRNNEGALALCMGIRIHTLNIEDITLFVEHGFFFEDNFFYELSVPKRTLKETILKDVDLCTQAIVNKHNNQSLPALYQNPNVARRLPAMKKINLKPQQIRQVVNFVEFDIKTNTYCNVVKARPNVLQMLCVECLIKGQE